MYTYNKNIKKSLIVNYKSTIKNTQTVKCRVFFLIKKCLFHQNIHEIETPIFLRT